jgi:hypothetical protein
MTRDQREVFNWTIVYLGLQNLPWDFHLRENTFPSHGISPALIAHISAFPSIKKIVSSQKKKLKTVKDIERLIKMN